MDQNLKRLNEIQETEEIVFLNGLNILKDPSANNNLNKDNDDGKTLLFFDFSR